MGFPPYPLDGAQTQVVIGNKDFYPLDHLPPPSFSSRCMGLRFLANCTAPGALTTQHPQSKSPGRTGCRKQEKSEKSITSLSTQPCSRWWECRTIKQAKNARQSWNILNVPAVVTEQSRDKEPEINEKPSVASFTKNLTTHAGEAKHS